jgi:hypothetical protein
MIYGIGCRDFSSSSAMVMGDKITPCGHAQPDAFPVPIPLSISLLNFESQVPRKARPLETSDETFLAYLLFRADRVRDFAGAK